MFPLVHSATIKGGIGEIGLMGRDGGSVLWGQLVWWLRGGDFYWMVAAV